MTNRLGRIPTDLEVQRRVREAHVLRAQYVRSVLRSLVRSVRSVTCALIGLLARRPAPSVPVDDTAMAYRQIETDKP
jgi:hypothetical protein